MVPSMTAQVSVVVDSCRSDDAVPPVRADRWSTRVFVVAVVVAPPLLLWFGRDQWFFLDEWSALTRDGLFKPGYFDGHNGHWVTLVRLEYRLNFELWGLRSYLPYQLPVVLAHLGTAALLREVIRRCGAREWIATATALAFVFFGSGRENITWGWQLSMTGSLVCGLALFLLADGPRALTRLDWLALGLGIVGLMTSSLFVALVVGIGVTTLLCRGVRIAAFYVLPLAAIHGAWYLRYGSDGAVPLRLTGRTLWFVGRMFWSIFDAVAQGGAGAVLAVLAGVGLASESHRAWRSRVWADVALPAGLAAGWLTFATLTSLARAGTPLTADSYGASRYVHLGAALLLPLAAVGAEQLARRRAALAAIALLPLAVGLPGNLDKLAHTPLFFRGNKDFILAMAHSPLIDDVPADTVAIQNQIFESPLTAGWLSRQAAAGRIPEPHGANPELGLTATSQVVLAQGAGAAVEPACHRVTADVPVTLQAGDQLRFTGAIGVSVTDGKQESAPRRFLSRDGSAIRALAGPVDVVVRRVEGLPARLCPSPA
jgi:hypothetical protein